MTRSQLAGKVVRRLLDIVGPFVGLVAVVVLFAFLTGDFYFTDQSPYVLRKREPTFLKLGTIQDVAKQTAIVGACGVGLTLVIIGGGIDLSVGSVVALVTVVVALVFDGRFFPALLGTVFLGNPMFAWIAAGLLTIAAFLAAFWRERSWGVGVGWAIAVWVAGFAIFLQSGGFAAVAAGACVGMLCGYLNGFLITTTRVVPFIITLGTMQIFRGIALLLAKSQTVGIQRENLSTNYPWLESLMTTPNVGRIRESATAGWVKQLPPWADYFALAPGVYVMLLAGLIAIVVLRKTRFGRYVFAIGSNEQAARLSGIAVPSMKIWMYALAGLMTGLAGVMQFSRLSAIGDATASNGLELEVIGAVVIGGGSLRGGAGSIVGTFVGAFIMGVLSTGCNIADIPIPVRQILIGVLIILAVAFDEIRHRRIR